MKKIISFLFAALFCLFVLAGCAPAKQEAALPTATQGAAAQASPAAGQTAKATAKPTVKRTEKPGSSAKASAKHSPSAAPAKTSGPSAKASAATTQSTAAPQAAAPSAEPDETPKPAVVSVPKPTAKPTPEPAPATVTCTVSIDCSTALSVNPDLANAVSSGGSILGGASVTIPAGGTVYDALVATGIGFGGSSGYISSINSMGEGDCGAGSGWMYSVNGSYPNVGCGSYTVADGDSIAWRYTCNMGADLGASVG